MTPFTRHIGKVARLDRDNIDTDAIIPSRETQSVVRTGYGAKLFANWRYSAGREENPQFVLNQEPYRRAVILLAGRNFGCGSSREAAAWALVQFGIRCVIAQSFGGIFRNNCIRNGLLPVALTESEVLDIQRMIAEEAGSAELTVDLVDQSVRYRGGGVAHFEIDPGERAMLLEGLDEIELTLKRREAIAAFAAAHRKSHPWVYPDRQPAQ
jgi:3-isopropylmalate/(R)-2-methylmalate dehydratase small subunit